MRHAACRRALLDGDLVPEVAEHLEVCDRCATFARDLGQVSQYAQDLTPPRAPEGLADRVITHVKRSAAAGPAVADPDVAREARAERPVNRLLRGPRHGPLLSSVAVAAVMLLLVGVLAALPGVRPDGDDDLDPLLTAAESTLDAGSARVRLSGTTSMTVTVDRSTFTPPEVEVFEEIPAFEPPSFEPPPPPDLEGIPEEFRDQVLEDYERSIRQFRAEQERTADDHRRQIEQLRQDPRGAFESLRVPDEFSFEMEVTGEGVVVFPDRLRIEGQMEIVDAEPPVDGNGGLGVDFGVVVADDATFVRGPNRQWFEVGTSTGPLGPVLVDADGVAAMLQGAEGDAEDLGEERLGDETVHHLRFPLTGSVVAPPDADATATVDVWVGADDDIVRKLEVSTSVDHASGDGFGARMESRMTLELFDFGAHVSIEAPAAAGRASSPLGPAAVLDPFDAAFGPSFHFGVTDLPEPPEFEPGEFGIHIPGIEPLDPPDLDFDVPEFEELDFESGAE